MVALDSEGSDRQEIFQKKRLYDFYFRYWYSWGKMRKKYASLFFHEAARIVVIWGLFAFLAECVRSFLFGEDTVQQHLL